MPAGLDLHSKVVEIGFIVFSVLVAAGIVGCVMMHVYVWK